MCYSMAVAAYPRERGSADEGAKQGKTNTGQMARRSAAGGEEEIKSQGK